MSVKFYEDGHVYTIGGVIVPSVSEVIKTVLDIDYSKIPPHILAEAARFGTSVHEGVEAFLDKEVWLPQDERETRCVFDYIHLMNENKWTVESKEEIVAFETIYAGRYDQIIQMKKGRFLMDVKTVYKLNMDSLSWQLSLYELALGEQLQGLKCVWLPKKGGGKVVDVPRIDREILMEVVNRVKEENESIAPF